MNLATNARDAMPKGGIFSIETSQAELDEEFVMTHGYAKPGRYALLTVSDTGIGMDEATQERIFEPFFTTKDAGRGTGLGLAMVYGIVKQHNGYIHVYSEPGRGTTFKIHLPISSGRVKEEKTAEKVFLIGGTETILLAEDDEKVRKLTEIILTAFGYNVLAVANGEDAIRMFREHCDAVRLVILDMIMPRKGGREAFEEIRKVRPFVKAMFTSGYTADKIYAEGFLEEGLDFIMKPVSPRDLLRKVREILDRP